MSTTIPGRTTRPARPARPAVLERPATGPSVSSSAVSPAPTDAAAAVTGDTSAAPRRDPLRVAVRLAPLLGLLACAGAVIWGLRAGVLDSQEHLQSFIDSLGAFGPVVLVLLSGASVVFPIIPGGILVLAAPVLFGPVEGTLLSYLAVCAGSFANFAIARHMGLGLIERAFSESTVEKYLGWTRRPRFTTLFATAIALPVAPDDLLCYLAGTTRMRWRTFALIILACKPWALLAYGLGVSALLMKVVPW
ncbi:TVP38/TMEM64 family protein [Brachybacterium kimchii]|uniref:TVP38/TMEM64 family membrane protein n=1 Tax=Brachybacterium kimchii TaxID=2942909 RepID=A0ABY4N994_9MICO|nr:TVP38/TMEM64 family protein [Brachybacterium kimchii]UQN31128.1 TVP38/TMEM64 family protein [Brachybacterium kimchii]